MLDIKKYIFNIFDLHGEVCVTFTSATKRIPVKCLYHKCSKVNKYVHIRT